MAGRQASDVCCFKVRLSSSRCPLGTPSTNFYQSTVAESRSLEWTATFEADRPRCARRSASGTTARVGAFGSNYDIDIHGYTTSTTTNNNDNNNNDHTSHHNHNQNHKDKHKHEHKHNHNNSNSRRPPMPPCP